MFSLTEDDQGHAVKPRSQVGQTPQQTTELDRINQIDDQKQTTQLGQQSVHVSHTNGSQLLDLLLGQAQFNLQEFSAQREANIIKLIN